MGNKITFPPLILFSPTSLSLFWRWKKSPDHPLKPDYRRSHDIITKIGFCRRLLSTLDQVKINVVASYLAKRSEELISKVNRHTSKMFFFVGLHFVIVEIEILRYNNFWNLWVIEITPRYQVSLFPQWRHTKVSFSISMPAHLVYINFGSEACGNSVAWPGFESLTS